MKLRMVAAVAATSAAVMVAGCGAPKTGVVYDKKYSAPYTWYSSHCTFRHSNGICMHSTSVAHHEAATYQLCLRQTDAKGKTHKGCRDVPPVEYERYRIGQVYP